MNINIIYASASGNTEIAALYLARLMRGANLFCASEVSQDIFESSDLLILGTSTRAKGLPQKDWDFALDVLRNSDLSHTAAAIFGLGDQSSYPLTFANGMRALHDAAMAAGARPIGLWPAKNYNFYNSAALEDADWFLGLVLDAQNQPEQSRPRLQAWALRLFDEINLHAHAAFPRHACK